MFLELCNDRREPLSYMLSSGHTINLILCWSLTSHFVTNNISLRQSSPITQAAQEKNL